MMRSPGRPGSGQPVSPLVYGPSSFKIAWICVAMSSDRGFDVGPRFVPLDVDAS